MPKTIPHLCERVNVAARLTDAQLDALATLEKAAPLPREWRFHPYSMKLRSGLCCPISMLDPEGPACSMRYFGSAKRLGLSDLDRESIVDAADNRPGHDLALRARLLDACGLAEVR